MAKIPNKQRIEYGRRVHSGEATTRQIADELDYSLVAVQRMVKLYRQSIGELPPKVKPGRKPKKDVFGPVAQSDQPMFNWELRAMEAESKLERAMDDMHTLQKILMTVGRSL